MECMKATVIHLKSDNHSEAPKKILNYDLWCINYADLVELFEYKISKYIEPNPIK